MVIAPKEVTMSSRTAACIVAILRPLAGSTVRLTAAAVLTLGVMFPAKAEFVSNEEPWGRLIRGGSIYSTPPLMRAAERMAVRADTVMISIGFRVARTLVNAE